MNVAELIEKLQTFDPTMKVILASDEEGNGFNSAEDFSLEFVEKSYLGGRLEGGELFVLDDEDVKEDEEVDHTALFQEVLVLWP